MPHVGQQEIQVNPQGFCCVECSKELRLGDHYHEVRREGRPESEFEAWCEDCAYPLGRTALGVPSGVDL